MRMQKLAGLSIWLSVAATVCPADVLYTVTIGTSPLIGHPAGPFSLDLQLTDGSGTGDGNNTAVLSDFSFSGGSGTGAPALIGGASGSLASSVTIQDSSFFNEFAQAFNPGATLSFQLALTTNLDAGAVPDEFSLAILDSSGAEIPMVNPANALLVVDIDSSSPAPLAFATDTSVSPNAGGPPINIAAPQVTPVGVPEPRTFLLLGAWLVALGAAAWFRDFRSVRSVRS